MLKTAIFLYIKDENEYLNEWLSYYFNIGITDIYICEDFNSLSHKEITNKYNKHVHYLYQSFDTCGSYLSYSNLKYIKCDKCLKNLCQSRQNNMYWKGFLITDIVKEYDWIITLDTDEFIVFKNDNTLESFLSKYADYKSVVLCWMICGANGNIKKPLGNQFDLYGCDEKVNFIYKHSNLIGEYTKSFINMHKFNKEKDSISNLHRLWDGNINTDYVNCDNKVVITYNHAYIKHLMTRSWEEWIKKCERSCIQDNLRYVDLFFQINEDMISYRDDLIKNLNESKFYNITLEAWK